MSSLRIQIRNAFKGLINEEATLQNKVSLYRRDRVERFPAAAVYLGNMQSVPETMGNYEGIEREVSILVDFFCESTDADEESDAFVVNLESRLARDIDAGTFCGGLVNDVSLESVIYAPTKRGEEREGDCMAVFRCVFLEDIATL